jgi:pilus assembly protein Flp/PilA
MRNAWKRLTNFLRREDGPTAVQYALLLLLALLACLTIITAVGKQTAGGVYPPGVEIQRPAAGN